MGCEAEVGPKGKEEGEPEGTREGKEHWEEERKDKQTKTQEWLPKKKYRRGRWAKNKNKPCKGKWNPTPTQFTRTDPPTTTTTTTTVINTHPTSPTAYPTNPPHRDGPIIAESPESTEGATLGQMPGRFNDAGKQGWMVLKKGASKRWEYGQRIVWS